MSVASIYDISQIVLAESDRPKSTKMSDCVTFYSNGRYTKIGYFAVRTTGKIDIYKASGYDINSNWVQMAASTSDFVSGNIIYGL